MKTNTVKFCPENLHIQKGAEVFFVFDMAAADLANQAKRGKLYDNGWRAL